MAIRPLAPLQIAVDNFPLGYELSLFQTIARQAARLSEPALARTADFFLEMSEKNNAKGTSPELLMRLSQSMLAALLGMSSVHMNRTMKSLKAMRVIKYTRGDYVVIDHGHLAKIAAGS